MRSEKLPISAITVSFNEGYLLDACLSKLTFCDEIILVDMESSDNTVEIAQKYATKILTHHKVPLVEIALANIIPKTKHDWILFMDPDGVVSDGLIDEIYTLFPTLNDKIGMVKSPYQYYFGKHALKGTRWGGVKTIRLLAHREKIHYSGNVHQGQKIRAGYEIFKINPKKDVVVHHYWMINNEQFLEKHMRYLLNEGKSQYDNGKRYSLFIQVARSVYGFVNSYFLKKAFLDGYLGFYLSVFWSWYVFMRWHALREYEKSLK